MTDAKRIVPERIAAIDIGTNSVLLLVAEVKRDGSSVSLTPVVERATITRLGQGVDKTRQLAPEAVERTLACLAEYGQEMARLGVVKADVVGTSAMRDAQGADAFRERARALVGVEPRVIAGEEEARLTFAGGLSGLDLSHFGDAVSVFDIGGGSTEFIRGTLAPRRIERAVSVDVGSVRLTERHVRTDPPTASELDACRADIQKSLDRAPPEALVGPLVGVAGTVTTIAAIARSIDPYDAAMVHGVRLSLEEIRDVARRLGEHPVDARAKLPGLSPKRADVIVAGALLCQAVVERAGATELVVSDRGVRWGVAEELVHSLPLPP